MHKTYQVLNGDALIDRFLATKLTGEMLVMRECLINGDLSGATPREFYQNRADYLANAYQEVPKRYFEAVVAEFEKLKAAPAESTFNLWFGYDLFCQANLWFLLALLQQLPVHKTINIVYPSHLSAKDRWLDFGGATIENLRYCYQNRVALTAQDLLLGHQLWQAYKNHDFQLLTQLSKQNSLAFPYLAEVVEAHVARFPAQGNLSRPEQVVKGLVANLGANFSAVYQGFSKHEGIYGFGDLQVKEIYDQVIKNLT